MGDPAIRLDDVEVLRDLGRAFSAFDEVTRSVLANVDAVIDAARDDVQRKIVELRDTIEGLQDEVRAARDEDEPNEDAIDDLRRAIQDAHERLSDVRRASARFERVVDDTVRTARAVERTMALANDADRGLLRRVAQAAERYQEFRLHARERWTSSDPFAGAEITVWSDLGSARRWGDQLGVCKDATCSKAHEQAFMDGHATAIDWKGHTIAPQAGLRFRQHIYKHNKHVIQSNEERGTIHKRRDGTWAFRSNKDGHNQHRVHEKAMYLAAATTPDGVIIEGGKRPIPFEHVDPRGLTEAARELVTARLRSSPGCLHNARPGAFAEKELASGMIEVRHVLISPLAVQVDLTAADFKKVGLDQMLRGVRTLEDEVLPRVAAGADGDALWDHDRSNGLDYEHGLQRIYDAFFRGDPIRVTWQEDHWDITDGRHRLRAAQLAGLRVVPATVVMTRRDWAGTHGGGDG